VEEMEMEMGSEGEKGGDEREIQVRTRRRIPGTLD
jgi:hypothetical protein